MVRKITRKRKPISKEIEARVLIGSARICCLCFGLKQDFRLRDGQIAHIDRDSSNSTYDNLAWLCLDHRDKYDTTPRLTKRLKPNEVKEYRDHLYQLVAEKRRKGQEAYLTPPLLKTQLAYVRFDPNCMFIYHSANVSSITDNGHLDVTIAFEESFETEKYVFDSRANGEVKLQVVTQSATAIRVRFEEPCPDVVQLSFYS